MTIRSVLGIYFHPTGRVAAEPERFHEGQFDEVDFRIGRGKKDPDVLVIELPIRCESWARRAKDRLLRILRPLLASDNKVTTRQIVKAAAKLKEFEKICCD